MQPDALDATLVAKENCDVDCRNNKAYLTSICQKVYSFAGNY